MNHKKELQITLVCLLFFLICGTLSYCFHISSMLFISVLGLAIGIFTLFFQFHDYLKEQKVTIKKEEI